jgi:hypothetical protein
MKPIQVYLDAADLQCLESVSREHGWTKSEAVRIAVRGLARQPGADSLASIRGMVRGLPLDLSARFDTYLEETFDAKKAPRRSRERQTRARSRR